MSRCQFNTPTITPERRTRVHDVKSLSSWFRGELHGHYAQPLGIARGPSRSNRAN